MHRQWDTSYHSAQSVMSLLNPYPRSGLCEGRGGTTVRAIGCGWFQGNNVLET